MKSTRTNKISQQQSARPPAESTSTHDWRSDLAADYRNFLEHKRRTPPPPHRSGFELAVLAAILSLKQEPGVPLHVYIGDAWDLLTVAELFNAHQVIAVGLNALSRPTERKIRFGEVLKNKLLRITTRKGLIGAIKRAFESEYAATIIKSGELSSEQLAAIKLDQQQRKQARAAMARKALARRQKEPVK